MTYTIRTVGCLVEYEDKILFLKRLPDKTQGGKFGLVAGKNDPGETDIQSIIREIKEEIGLDVLEEQLEFVGDWTWKFPNKTVEFPVYRLKLKVPIVVKISPCEHCEYAWMTAEEAYKRDDMIHGLHDLLELIGYVKKD